MTSPIIYDKNAIENLCSIDPLVQTEAAFQLIDAELSYEDLIKLISNPNQNLKHLGLLKISEIRNKNDAEIIVSCLTGNESRIRELTSYKIKSFIQKEEYRQYFQNEYCLSAFCDGIMDVNPQVCRNISSILNFVENKLFLTNKIINIMFDVTKKVANYSAYQDHKYVRLIFTLYWNFEALTYLFKDNDIQRLEYINDLIKILEVTSDYTEYTIREKSAALTFLLDKNGVEGLEYLKDKFLKDGNFYVRQACTNLSYINMSPIKK